MDAPLHGYSHRKSDENLINLDASDARDFPAQERPGNCSMIWCASTRVFYFCSIIFNLARTASARSDIDIVLFLLSFCHVKVEYLCHPRCLCNDPFGSPPSGSTPVLQPDERFLSCFLPEDLAKDPAVRALLHTRHVEEVSRHRS